MCNAGPKGPEGPSSQTGKYIIVGKTQADIINRVFWTSRLARQNGYVTIPQSRIAEYIREVFHVKHLRDPIG